MNPEIEEKIQSIILDTFQDVESEWVSYFQHKAEQMGLDKKPFFIGMIYPKITERLEENNIHIRIKSDSWGNHENERINSMLNLLYEKHI